MRNQSLRQSGFRRLALAGAATAALVVVLGAWVRLTDAGLGCPDWPGCYGHLYPQASGHAGKAWHEMIHRYAVGSLSVIITALVAWTCLNRKDRDQPKVPVLLLSLLLCLQAALGAFTVTMLLNPLIVTAHLIGGLTTLALLSWLAIVPERRDLQSREQGLRAMALGAAAVLLGQLCLGGWTSTNYAAVACPDFPTCQRAWWPRMNFHDAFVLWRGLGIDYEGGILPNAARTAIHFSHRLGAAVTGVILVALGILTASRAGSRRLRGAGVLVIIAVIVQLSIGIATVRFGVPLPLATLHNAGAALLVMSMTWLLRALWPAPLARVVPLARDSRPA